MLLNKLPFILFLCATVLISCGEKPEKKIENIVNASYLKTDAYRSFEKSYRQEQQKNLRQKRFILSFINENITTAKTLPASAVIDEKIIKNVLQQPATENPFGPDSYFTVGKVQFNKLTLFLFVQNKTSVYSNSILIGATAISGNIEDIRPLASFRKNLTEDMKSQLKFVSEENIKLQINHIIEYPQPQKKEIVYRYPITEDGHILVGDTYGLQTSMAGDMRYGFSF